VVLFILSICVFSDIGGYIIGKSLGGKKLTKISPNKTISGSFGSFVFSLLPLIYFQSLITNFNMAILFCFGLSLLCQLGDLFISYFKRKARVKDTGNILPGHGGILDRIDGIIFAVPISSIFIIFYLL
jgi:phosphatidate cytidylyltransferase